MNAVVCMLLAVHQATAFVSVSSFGLFQSSISRERFLLCTQPGRASSSRLSSYRQVRVPSEGAGVRMELGSSHSAIAEWVVANGGFVHSAVSPVDRGEAGVGLSVSADVNAGQVLLALPPRLQVSTAYLTGAEAAAAENEVPPNKWDVKLALALLALKESAEKPGAVESPKKDKQPASKAGGFGAPAAQASKPKRNSLDWGAYLYTLPSALKSLPIFFTGAQLREYETEFPKMQGEVGGRVQLLKSVASALPKEGGFAKVSLRALAWAYGIVTSRAVRLQGSSEPGVLLPLLDLANHDFMPSAEIKRLGDQKDKASVQLPPAVAKLSPESACLVALRALKAGDDVTLCYGDLSNAELILEYGFRVDGNKRGETISPFAESPDLSMEDLQFVSEEELLNAETVDKVLETVRPFLIADGGNCRVVEVDAASGDVRLELQGACGSCPSSVVTLKNGIEKTLREAFGDRLGSVIEVGAAQEAEEELSEEVCLQLLEPVMGAVTGLGGEMTLVRVDAGKGNVTIRFKGPEKLRLGIEMTLKDDERVQTVTFE
jgi:Fe-S cluster biogenesis protein NfuA